MLRRFLFLSVGGFALTVVLGAPGQLHAQRFRASLPPAIQPGFQGVVVPRFRVGVSPVLNRGFNRFNPGLNGGFSRRFDRFDPRFNRGFFDPRFNMGFSPGFNMGFSPGFFRPF
jgi:hypothetical protein